MYLKITPALSSEGLIRNLSSSQDWRSLCFNLEWSACSKSAWSFIANIRGGSWQNGFFADFYFEPDFFRGFCRRIVSPHFCGGKSAQKNPPGKSDKTPRHILQRGRAKIFSGVPVVWEFRAKIFSGVPVVWEFKYGTLKLNRITDFHKYPCESTCLYNAPSLCTVDSLLILIGSFSHKLGP